MWLKYFLFKKKTSLPCCKILSENFPTFEHMTLNLEVYSFKPFSVGFLEEMLRAKMIFQTIFLILFGDVFKITSKSGKKSTFFQHFFNEKEDNFQGKKGFDHRH